MKLLSWITGSNSTPLTKITGNGSCMYSATENGDLVTIKASINSTITVTTTKDTFATFSGGMIVFDVDSTQDPRSVEPIFIYRVFRDFTKIFRFSHKQLPDATSVNNDDNTSTDSKTKNDFNIIPDDDDEIAEDLAEVTAAMSKANLGDALSKATALAKLNPRFSSFDVKDPEYMAYGISVSRKVLMIQLDVPPGADKYTLFQKVKGQHGTKLGITATEDASRYDSNYCLPDELKHVDPRLVACADRPLKTLWSERSKGRKDVVDTYYIDLPFGVEPEIRDPRYNYRKGRPGWNGAFQETPTGNFLWLFYFAKEDPDNIHPHESLPQEVTVGRQNKDSPYSQRNMAQQRARMYDQDGGGLPTAQSNRRTTFSQGSTKKGKWGHRPSTDSASTAAGTKTAGLDGYNVHTGMEYDSQPDVAQSGSGDSGTDAYADAADGYTSHYV